MWAIRQSVDDALLARHRASTGRPGHDCLARLVQGTVCKRLGQEEIKRIGRTMERATLEFERKMAGFWAV